MAAQASEAIVTRVILAAMLTLSGCVNLPGGEATIYPPDQVELSQQWMMTNDPHHPWEFYPQMDSGR